MVDFTKGVILNSRIFTYPMPYVPAPEWLCHAHFKIPRSLSGEIKETKVEKQKVIYLSGYLASK